MRAEHERAPRAIDQLAILGVGVIVIVCVIASVTFAPQLQGALDVLFAR